MNTLGCYFHLLVVKSLIGSYRDPSAHVTACVWVTSLGFRGSYIAGNAGLVCTWVSTHAHTPVFMPPGPRKPQQDPPHPTGTVGGGGVGLRVQLILTQFAREDTT